jgi:hypothetical protein
VTTGIWSFDPIPFGGDLIITIVIQTFLTYLISGFLISNDLGIDVNFFHYLIILTFLDYHDL